MILGGALANLRGEKPRRRLSKRLGRVRGGGDAFVRGDWLRRANAANTRDGGGARGEHRRRATAETRANQSRLKFRARRPPPPSPREPRVPGRACTRRSR